MNGNTANIVALDSLYLDAFTDLGSDDQLEGAAEGIWRQVTDPRGRSLSDRQWNVIKETVIRFCRSHVCDICGSTLEIDDVDPFLRSRYCGRHLYVMSKDD